MTDEVARQYYEYFSSGADRYHKFFWRGVDILKAPEDAWALQQIIVDTRPDVIVETGAANGGSTLFIADICELEGHGEVISCEVAPFEFIASKTKEHPRVTLLATSSVSAETASVVASRCRGKRVMVVLDSDHSMSHVLRELDLYAPLVSSGCYLLVEDTNINGHPALPGFGPGPAEALALYLRTHAAEWTVDRSREKFITFNPCGYLLRR